MVTATASLVRIKELKFRIAVCSANDVVEQDGTMTLRRVVKVRLWAKIKHSPFRPSFMTPEGYAVLERYNNWETHKIWVRAGAGLVVSTAAWVYEERLQAPPRWYKVLGFVEDGHWLMLSCHLVERSDQVKPPVGGLQAVPSPVEL
jgi:hypothetical protein